MFEFDANAPELLRSWVCDVIGLFDQDYRRHDRAQVWAAVTERAAALVHRAIAPRLIEHSARRGAGSTART
jgi:hypothetical protein